MSDDRRDPLNPTEMPTMPPPAAPPNANAETLPPPDHSQEPPPPDDRFPPVPGYEVLGELGRGGMGVVYKARQVQADRLVALKMILAGGHAGAAELARFRTEAEAIARLQHPNIVQIYEVGEHNGLPFFSLEFCGGGSLDGRLQMTPLPPREAAALVESLARAMHAAHEKGVLHRDLKPANVLLAGDGTPKITDFGLAKKLDEASQTASGAVMGTPSYMAPEQAGGRSEEIGPACDVYALGAILYECLTGRPPFKAATVIETIMQVVADEPAPPTRLLSSVPRDLETVCLKCLQKEHRKRYTSALALADDLRRFLDDVPVLARPAGRAERAWRWCRRNRALAASLAAVAIALVAGTIASTAFGVRAAADAARAEKSADEARRASAELEEKEKQTGDVLYATAVSLALREWQAAGGAHAARQLLKGADEGRRGWEWHFLNDIFENSSVPLSGHSQLVLAAALSPDGAHVVTASADRTVRVWGMHDGVEQRRENLPDAGAHRLAHSPDGRLLAVAVGGSIAIAEAATGREPVIIVVDQRVCGLGFLPDGEELLAVLLDGNVRTYDVRTGAERRRLARVPVDDATSNRVSVGQGVAVSPDGRLLAQGFRDGRVCVWDAASGAAVLDVAGHLKQTGQVAFSPDGKRLASPGGEGAIRVWDLEAKKTILELRGHPSDVHAVAFSPDGKRIASGSKDTTVRVWDAQTGEPLLVLRGHESEVYGVAFGGADRLVSFGPDNKPRVWDVRDRVVFAEPVRAHIRERGQRGYGGVGGLESLALFGHVGPTAAVALSPDGRLAASAALGRESGHEVVLWDLQPQAPKREVRRLTVTTQRLHRLAFSPDGSRLAVGSGGGGSPEPAELTVFDVATGREVWRYRGGPPCNELRPAFAPDGRRLAVVASVPQGAKEDTRLLAWDAATGELKLDRRLPGPSLRASFTPDGRALVTAGADRPTPVGVYFFVWDAATGDEVRRWPAPRGLMDAVCGPGGLIAAADALDASLALYDLESGRMLRELKGHVGQVKALAFSPDGARLISGGTDFTARVWHVVTGANLLTFRDHTDAVMDVAWSDDGSAVGTAGLDGAVRVWQGPASSPPRTDDWPHLYRESFDARDGLGDDWRPAEGTWAVRGGALRGTQAINKGPGGGDFNVALAELRGVPLPRTVEVRFTCRMDRPAVVAAVLRAESGSVGFAPILDGTSKLFGKPLAFLLQITDETRMSFSGVKRPLTLEPGRPHAVRLLREPGRLRVWVDGAERLDERIPDIDLTRLLIQGAWGDAGDEVAFDDVEVRAPAAAVREQALRSKARDLFSRLCLKEEVRRALLAGPDVKAEDHPLITRIVAGLVENPTRTRQAALETASRPGAAAGDYALALRQAESLARVAPDDVRLLTLLGMAQYRAGQAVEAVKTLARAAAASRRDQGAARPEHHAYLAMAHHRLGRREDARDHLIRLRDLMRGDFWAADEGARANLTEAREVCGAAEESADVEAIKNLFATANQAGWQYRRLAQYLAMFADDVHYRDGRAEEPGPHDAVLDRRRLEAVNRRDFLRPPPDLAWWHISYQDVRVAVRGDDAELTLTSTILFDANFLAFGVRHRLARTAQGWRVREAHSWPLAVKESGRRTVYDAETWARLDREADRLKGGADRLAHLRALKLAWRWRELFEAAGNAAEAEALVLRGEAAHKLGRTDDALTAFRAAEAARPDVELPWYMTRLRRHFRGHGTSVYGVAYHPDGRHVFSAGDDAPGRLWDAETLQEIRRFEGAQRHASGAALSPDGKTAAVGREVLRLFDVGTAKPLHECRGHRELVYRVAFSPDGKRLVSASADDTARIWEVATGKEVLTLRGHAADVLDAVFSPDGKTVATASRDKTARLWDAATGALLHTFIGHDDRLVRVAFRPDGARIVTASVDKTVRVWDVATGQEVRKLDGHSAYVEVALFSPDGSRVASADGEGVILVHDAETGKLLLRMRETSGTVYGLSFRSDGKVLAAAGRDGVFLWDVTPGNEGEILTAGGVPQ